MQFNVVLFALIRNLTIDKGKIRTLRKVSLLGLGVVALWGDCTFILADWGS